MGHLRSPASHNAGPSFHDLRQYGLAVASGENCYIPPYHRPSVSLFDRHLKEIAQSATVPELTWFSDHVTAIDRDSGGDGYTLRLRDSDTFLHAKRVILALGQPRPAVPEPFARCEKDDRIAHVYDEGYDPDAGRPGERILVVGGGIAAAHLVMHYRARPVETIWWYRDPLSVVQFDSDPCFIGPRCRSLWDAIDNPENRRALIRRSRRNGSIPSNLAIPLFEEMRNGHVRTVRGVVSDYRYAGDRRIVVGNADGRSVAVECDRVVLATGFAPEVPQVELIAVISDALGLLRTTDGFPIVSPSLEWAPGLFCTGALAEHELGPPARNIIGAHLARRRIVPAVIASLET